MNHVAVGSTAFNSGTGSDNIMIGYGAGSQLPPSSTASNNIYIGNDGFNQDNNTIRIGNPSHVGTIVGGIAGQTSAGGIGVFINGGGRMGTVTSSVRFKEDIHSIGEVREKLLALRPVQFVYKPDYDDGSRTAQFGLIAELSS